MNKKYVATAYLQQHDQKLYGIFAWSQRSPEIITDVSWLSILEIFIHEHDLNSAYEIYQKVSTAPIPDKVKAETAAYEDLMGEAIVVLSDNNLTLLGKGFRSFIEKELQYELGLLSQSTYQVLRQLYQGVSLKDDLKAIQTLADFTKQVKDLEKLGLLSPAKGTVDWGDLKKSVPICQAFGLTRGTPVDRYYLQKYLTEIKPQIVGEILEVGGIPKDRDFYQVNSDSRYRNLNLEAGPGIDIAGDVHDVSVIEPESLDSVIIFNVLEHCYAPWIAIDNIYKWLKKGGKCFAMVPSAIRVHATPVDYWRPLPDAFSWMFRNYSGQKLYVYGNPISVIASYHGIAVEELTTEDLDAFHPDYPVATCIVAEK